MNTSKWRFVSLFVCAGLPIVTGACRLQPDASAPEQVQTVQAALDFETGSVQGTIFWGGAPVADGEGSVLFAYESDVFRFRPSGSVYSAETVTPGVHTLGFYSATFCLPPLASARLGEVTFAVSAGAPTTADIDLTTTSGRVTGTIAASGVPLPDALLDLEIPCASRIRADSTGHFSALLPPGSYSASLFSAEGTRIGSLPISVLAGDTTNLGMVDIPAGRVAGTLSWNGVPLSSQEGSALLVSESPTSFFSPEGATYSSALTPGSHTLGFYNGTCIPSPEALKLGEVTVSITSGATTTADVDFGATSGRVTGTIAVNGVPRPNAIVRFDVRCARDARTDSSGVFTALLAPGTYSAGVFDTSFNKIGSFSFSVVGAETTNVGVIDNATGNLEGDITWNGAPLNGFGWRAYESLDLMFSITGPSFSVPAVAPGPHTIGFYRSACIPPHAGGKFGEVSFTIAPGTTTRADVDLTATAGRLTGSIMVNGSPMALAVLVTDVACGAGFRADSAGLFSSMFPPGSYSMSVFNIDLTTKIGSFTFPIVAGQTTDVDSVTTLPGAGSKTELLGGKDVPGGLTLTFTDVTDGGNTTVVESGVGPAPATGFEITGPGGEQLFWDIESDAEFTPPIEVCIGYNPADFLFFGNECDLSIGHDEASVPGPEIVGIEIRQCASTSIPTEGIDCDTGNPCTDPRVICGSADSLSPFALLLPIVTTPTDVDPPVFGGLPANGIVPAFATSTSGAVVNYALPTATDAVEGPRPVKCLPAPGSQFPVNRTPVTCTTADSVGNTNTTMFDVWVTYEAPTDGSFFLRPVRANGKSVFLIGRALPVKFALTGASHGITDLRAKLIVTRISDQIRGTEDDVSDEDGDETDFLFKYRPRKGLYAYRWKTSCQTPGTYQLRADLGDGVLHEISVSLKSPKHKK